MELLNKVTTMVTTMEWGAFLNKTCEYAENVYEFVLPYVDLYYFQWLLWILYPVIVTFILPAMILLGVYASGLFLHVYRLRHLFHEAYSKRDFWRGGKTFLSAIWDFQGKLWHGYEIIGFEKIPDDSAAILVYYHGAIPIDLYYVIAKCVLHKKQHPRAIGDRFLFKIPGFKLLMEVFGVLPGSVSSGIKLMNEGQVLAVAPGGVREAYFSDEYYNLLWSKRVGFARIAIEAKVPIIPMFTQNCREAFRAVQTGRSWLRKIYEKTRLPIVPIYGMFPVKMRTFIGDPIPYDPSLSPEQLSQKVQEAIQGLIRRHQTIPGSILRALTERFYTPEHCKQS